MNQIAVLCVVLLTLAALAMLEALRASPASAEAPYETDVFPTSAGELGITFIGHASLVFSFGGRILHADPYGEVADYAALPKADAILITHEHFDHLDRSAIKRIATPATEFILSPKCAKALGRGTAMKNGDSATVLGLPVRAVPAYNIVNRRPNGVAFHPKGEGNGYILTFGDTTVYIAGDTENTPEMRALSGIDIAFLPMNLPYTMSPEMAADAALAFRPKILYPYHYEQTDVRKIADLLRDSGVKVRVRSMD